MRDDLDTTGETVAYLTPSMHGRWLTTTAESRHVWTIESGVVVWTRLPAEGRQVVADEPPVRVTRVVDWPLVGQPFFIFFADPVRPHEYEHWCRSSAVTRIDGLLPLG